ncbi:MAG: hypothetical protein ACE14V_06320 [bacterium]
MPRSFEELTFELLDHKETLDAAIREYDRAVNQIRRQNKKGMIIIGIIFVAALICLGIAIHNTASLFYDGGLFKSPFAWIGLIGLIVALVQARGLYKRISRFSNEERRLRSKREAITEKYAEISNELEKLRLYNKKISQKPPTAH